MGLSRILMLVCTLLCLSASVSTFGYDPDEDRDIEEYILYYGYQFEKYFVATDDGYHLCLYRLINPCLKSMLNVPPLILCYGLFHDAMIYLFGNPDENPISCETGLPKQPLNRNIAMELADRGYDVWLPNLRGTIYSRNHSYLDPNTDPEFWDFTFDEMGIHDAPALVDFILEKTGQGQIVWIGHSMGTTVPFVVLSTQPEYIYKFKLLIAMAPITNTRNTRNPLQRLLADTRQAFVLQNVIGEISKPVGPLKQLNTLLCDNPVTNSIYATRYFNDYGYDPAQTNFSRLGVYFNQQTSTSISTLLHYGQLSAIENFQRFDRGYFGNWVKYGSPAPPLYDLSNIRLGSIVIIASANDKSADIRDVMRTIKRLPVRVDYRPVSYLFCNHMGFLTNIDRSKYINGVVVQALKKYLETP